MGSTDVRVKEQTEGEVDALRSEFDQLRTHVEQQILGQSELVERLLMALLADGHLLVEGAPGLAKTKAVKALASGLKGDFHRIQFTPDLLPADLTGTEIYRPQDGSFHFDKGPVFHNFVLADEVNRAPAKVQSALLEAMGERQVTVGRETFHLPELFLVMATQNPIEQEGTYPLPEAQLDRFLLKIDVNYPDLDTERRILIETTGGEDQTVRAALDAPRLMALQALVRKMPVGEKIVAAILALVREARPEQTSDARVKRLVDWGPSPRAGQALMLAARARALLRGRFAPSLEDVEALAEPALGHRMAMRYDPTGEAPGLTDLINDLARKVA